MKITYRFGYCILALGIAALVAGCPSATTPTTQPTAQGVLTADTLNQSYTAAANTETALIKSGTLSASAVAKIKADDNAVYTGLQAINAAALAGSSGVTALLSVVQSELTTLQGDLPAAPATTNP